MKLTEVEDLVKDITEVVHAIEYDNIPWALQLLKELTNILENKIAHAKDDVEV